MLFMIKQLGAPTLITLVFWTINSRKSLGVMLPYLVVLFVACYVTFAIRIDIFCYICGLVLLIGFWRWMNAED